MNRWVLMFCLLSFVFSTTGFGLVGMVFGILAALCWKETK